MLARFETSTDDGTLFLTVDGTVCSPGWLTQMACGYVTRAAIGKTGACHLFRHTMATLMLEGGANVRYIQAILGNSRLETTELYTRVSIRHLQAVHAACHLAAENVRHRSPNHPTLHLVGPAGGPDGDGVELWIKRSKKRTAQAPDRVTDAPEHDGNLRLHRPPEACRRRRARGRPRGRADRRAHAPDGRCWTDRTNPHSCTNVKRPVRAGTEAQWNP